MTPSSSHVKVVESIAFLDTSVKLDQEYNTIYTTLYTTPTDTHSYLHDSSSYNNSCTQKALMANS